MNEDTEFSTPDEPDLLRFVAPGMRLTFELASIGQIKAALGQSIVFCPVLSVKGWSKHKESVASLRLKHIAGGNREISRCLLDQDEVVAWTQLLRRPQVDEPCCGSQVTTFEYATRHGIRWMWDAREESREPINLLHISSSQAAILPDNFIDQLLKIFEDFESFCSETE